MVPKKPKKKISLTDSDAEKTVSPCSSVTFDNPNLGFNRGLEPEKIIGIRKANGIIDLKTIY